MHLLWVLAQLVTLDHSETAGAAGIFSSIISANCGSNVTLNATVGGNITSPNYPNDYDNNHRCFWNIWSEEGTVVQLTILHFQTEPRFDVLQVRVAKMPVT